MSDEEEEFEYSDAEEGAGEAEGDDSLIKADNAYYSAKRFIEEGSLDAAQTAFESVLALETASGGRAELLEWGFKATKQLVKLAFRRGRYKEMLSRYM